MTRLWSQHPEISSPPKEVIEHFVKNENSETFECAIFLLENSKYLFIRFSSEDVSDPDVGFTELEEFDDAKDAAILYKSYTEIL